jgi:hypothetical protein
MDLLKALLGNGSVNTFQRAKLETVSQWTNFIARCQAAASAPRDWRERDHVTCEFSLFLFLLFDTEEECDMFLRNISWLSPDYTPLYPRRLKSSRHSRFHRKTVTLLLMHSSPSSCYFLRFGFKKNTVVTRIRSLIPCRGKGLSLLHSIQTGSGTKTASLLRDSGLLTTKGKAAGACS